MSSSAIRGAISAAMAGEFFCARSRCVVAVALIGLSGSASAQIYTFETHGKEIDRTSKIIPLPEFGEFGEGTDYSSGVTTFRKTLVEVRGNNVLRVAADYIAQLRAPPGGIPYYAWEKDVPYIEGSHSSEYGWIIGYAPTNYSNNRCSDPRALSSGGAATIRIPKPVDNIVPADYWDGNSLYTPDAGGGLIRPISDAASPSGVDIKWQINGDWRFSCYTLPGGGEGFVGHRSNGDKYYFGVPVATNQNLQILSPNRTDADGWLDVDKFRMYVSRIEDRFGNWVNYEDTQITSSDGRTITFQAGGNGTIVQANGRQWIVSGSANPATATTTITNPDGSIWSFARSNSLAPTFSGFANSCSAENQIPSSYSGQMTVVVTTESGATGTFLFQPRRFGFSDVWFQCEYALSGYKEAQNYSNIMHFHDNVALVSRTVSGPGLHTYIHTIDYGPVNACYGTGPLPAPPNPCTPNTPTTRTTTITNPDGSSRTLTFGNKFFDNAGLLLAETEGGLQTRTFENISLYINGGIAGKRMIGYDVSSFHVYRQRKVTTQLQGRLFTMEVPNTCGSDGASPCFDTFFRPTRVTRSSTMGP